MSIWTSGFWKATTERALKTAGQAGAAFLGVDFFGILDVDPVAFASVIGLAVVGSALTSLGSIPVTGGPSLGGEALAVKANTHRADA